MPTHPITASAGDPARGDAPPVATSASAAPSEVSASAPASASASSAVPATADAATPAGGRPPIVFIAPPVDDSDVHSHFPVPAVPLADSLRAALAQMSAGMVVMIVGTIFFCISAVICTGYLSDLSQQTADAGNPTTRPATRPATMPAAVASAADTPDADADAD